MANMMKETIKNSELSGSGKYNHEVFLNTLEDGYQVIVIRHHNWGVGKTEVFNIKKPSLNEAKEIYEFYLKELEATV